jgi:hypothetical protein
MGIQSALKNEKRDRAAELKEMEQKRDRAAELKDLCTSSQQFFKQHLPNAFHSMSTPINSAPSPCMLLSSFNQLSTALATLFASSLLSTTTYSCSLITAFGRFTGRGAYDLTFLHKDGKRTSDSLRSAIGLSELLGVWVVEEANPTTTEHGTQATLMPGQSPSMRKGLLADAPWRPKRERAQKLHRSRAQPDTR